MIRTKLRKKGSFLSRSAICAALALGVVAGGTMVAEPALAARPPRADYSRPFLAAAQPFQKAFDEAKVRADVVAARAQVDAATTALQQARGNDARNTARTNREAAIAALGATLTNEKALLEALYAAVQTADDRQASGKFALDLGSLGHDLLMQRRGIASMLESGKLDPASQPRMHYYVGSFSYDLRDFATARTSLQTAVDAGFFENDAELLLADSYMSDNQVPQGLEILSRAIARRKAAGSPAPESWYRRGLGTAYRAQLTDQAFAFSASMVEAYPTTENWSGAIAVLREVGRFPAQETLDLMRLMKRTASFSEERDYVEYIQVADARRLPGEVIEVINAGVAAGKVDAADTFVAEARTIASGRIAADRASLPGLERDARAANATAATAMAAGDAFLSYGDAARAVEMYTIALGRPGVDTPRVTTRLGIAQFDTEAYAAAIETFAKVEGSRKPIAQLWSIHAAQQAAGAN